jgi:hypothetical protein
VTQRGNNVRNAHSTGPETALTSDRPSARCLRSWAWHSDGPEHDLRDANGTLLACLESNAGRHRLTYPRTRPILSWPFARLSLERVLTPPRVRAIVFSNGPADEFKSFAHISTSSRTQ